MIDDLRERVARAMTAHHTIPWDEMPEMRRRRLLAYADAAIAEIGGVRVRELEWKKSLGGDSIRSYHEGYGSAAYFIIQESNHLAVRYGAHLIKVCDDWSDAKAAAQADYEARILAAIEPAPVSVREAARVLLGHTPKITAKPLAEMSEAMKIDAHPAILLRGFCAALRAIEDGKDDD